MELTIVELPPPAPELLAKKNPMFRETDPSKATVDQPTEKTFESNVNSKAASELPATGSARCLLNWARTGRKPIWKRTTQRSVRPGHNLSQPLRRRKSRPRPSLRRLAHFHPVGPTGHASRHAHPGGPSLSHAAAGAVHLPADEEQKRMSGGISNRGPSSIHAVGTPLGPLPEDAV